MFNIISTIFGLVIINLSLIGYGNIFYNIKRGNDLFFIIIVGYFIVGFIVLFLHFFLPINIYVSLLITSLGLFLLFISRFDIFEKKFIYTIICLIFANILLLGYSDHPIDANMYHHPYVSYLKSEKIIYSIANIEFRFGHISLLQYVQSVFTDNFFNPLNISSINIIFFIFYLLFCFENLFYKNKNNFIFLIVLFFSSFVLIKMGRYREFGNDLIPFLVGTYFFIRIFKEKILFDKNLNNTVFTFVLIYSSFMLAHKVTYLFSSLIFLGIINKTKLFMLLKNKYLIIIFFSFTSLWFLKNYIETSCLVYPIVQTCFINSGWYLRGLADPQNAMWLSEIWAKGFIDNPNWESLDLEDYSKNFNWLNTWLNNHFIKILEKMSPLFAIMIIITPYLFFINNKKHYRSNNNSKIYIKTLLIFLLFILSGLLIWLFKSPLFRYGTFYIVAFFILAFLILNFKKIFYSSYLKIEKLKVIFLISIIFFVSKNINRQINSINEYLPLTKPSIENYEFLNQEPKILNPTKIQLCYLTDFVCSHEVPNDFQIFKKNNHFLIK